MKKSHLNSRDLIRRAPVAPESVNIFNRKDYLRIASWNVRTVSGIGELNVLASTARAYEIDILCAQETRRPEAGYCNLHAGQGYYYHWHPSIEKAPGRAHLFGVGMLMSPRAFAAMSGWKAVNDRLMSARFKYKHGSITVVCAYAPHEGRSDEEKDEFYDQLNRLMNGVARSLLLVGI